MQNHLKNELHNVLSGKSQIRLGTIIQTIASYLNDGAQASKTIEVEKHHKKQETERLEDYIFCYTNSGDFALPQQLKT